MRTFSTTAAEQHLIMAAGDEHGPQKEINQTVAGKRMSWQHVLQCHQTIIFNTLSSLLLAPQHDKCFLLLAISRQRPAALACSKAAYLYPFAACSPPPHKHIIWSNGCKKPLSGQQQLLQCCCTTALRCAQLVRHYCLQPATACSHRPALSRPGLMQHTSW